MRQTTLQCKAVTSSLFSLRTVEETHKKKGNQCTVVQGKQQSHATSTSLLQLEQRQPVLAQNTLATGTRNHSVLSHWTFIPFIEVPMFFWVVGNVQSDIVTY